MTKVETKKTHITLDEARKTKGRSNPAQIIAEQRKELLAEKTKSNNKR